MKIDWTTHCSALLIALASSTDNFLVGFSRGLHGGGSASSSSSLLPLFWTLTLPIAVCNATGAMFATAVGGRFTLSSGKANNDKNRDDEEEEEERKFPFLEWHHAAAGITFFYLAWKEYSDLSKIRNRHHHHKKVEGSDRPTTTEPAAHTTTATQASWIPLAVPMTLNNLAGGVATGIAAVSHHVAAAYVLVVSILTMQAGAALGQLLCNRHYYYLSHRRQQAGKKIQATKSMQQEQAIQLRAVGVSIFLYCLLAMHNFYEALPTT
jgi:putative Mn2+ efflux pump MntP